MPVGETDLPERPMYRSPHKKVNGWKKGYLPEFGKQSGSSSGHGGNTPPGKLKRMARTKKQPPGFPQGVHIDAEHAKRLGMKACFCGRCFEKNNGAEELVYG